MREMAEQIQLSIVIPIASDELNEMTAKEIVDAIKAGNEIKQLKAELASKRFAVNNFGNTLEQILDEVDGSLERAKTLRWLAQEMKKWK